MLIRDERQIAINEVESLCVETADRYAAMASNTEDAALAQLFDSLSRQRRQFADDLAVHIRAMDDLPRHPDPDRETAGQVLAGIKAFLSVDPRATLIEERERAEEVLAATVQAALKQNWTPDAQALLERILAHTETARQQLAAARS